MNTHMSWTPERGRRAKGLLIASACLFVASACGQREKAPPQLREISRDASDPILMVDAPIVRGLGKLSSIRIRFESECPPDLPRAIGIVPSLNVSEKEQICRRSVAERGREDVVRYVEVGVDGSMASQIWLGYYGAKGSARPVSCQGIADEVAAYLRDLTGASERDGDRVAALMRSHPSDVPRVHLMDRELCVWSWASGEVGECFAHAAICDLAPQGAIVDIDITTVEVPPRAP